MAPATIQKKTVLITGCSTGSIGWALAKVFLEHDFHVFAGVRSRSKARDLAELSNVDLVELDVTVSQTILQCKEMVAEHTGENLDVLVSTSIPGAYFEVTRHCLPLLNLPLFNLPLFDLPAHF